MCGLNGIYAYHDAALPPSEAELIATREHMVARGPDGAGIWWSNDRRMGLGHRRLAILDLSDRAAQPMISDDGRLIVVFNGEIYNTPELRAQLISAGRRFHTTSDTEVLLHLYAVDRGNMVQRLRGMFAFAIWDTAARSLFLARDPYGIKPLYYANDGWTFRFASQVKALLAGGGVSRDPEAAGVVGFHLWGHVPEPFSLYRDVRALPAGHTILIDRWGPREPERYASVAEILTGGRQERLTKEICSTLIAEGTRDSVRAHLLADVEVGIFLSAGVDSGALLGLARDAGLSKPRAITLGFSEFAGSPDDEAPLASDVARHYSAEHIVRVVGETEFRRDLPKILEAMDQPSVDGINSWFVAKAAHEASLKVALSGLGGDELLGGYPSFVDIPRWRRRYGWLARLPGAGKLARLLMNTLVPDVVAKTPKSAHVLNYANCWEGAYLLRRGLFMPAELNGLLDPGIVRDGLQRLGAIRRLRATLTPDPGTDSARVCALESSHYMRDQLLRDADWAGMAHGVEVRTPLVDTALLRTVAPAIHRLQPGDGKEILANAPNRPLPRPTVERAKTGFSVPGESWMAAVAGPDATVLPSRRGLVSRRWANLVLSELEACAPGNPSLIAEVA